MVVLNMRYAGYEDLFMDSNKHLMLGLKFSERLFVSLVSHKARMIHPCFFDDLLPG